MPRHRSRFSNLEAQFRAAGGSAPADSALGKYISFKSGKTKITRRRDALTEAERTRYGVAIFPFNIDYPATPSQEDRYVATITQYSNAGRTALGLSSAECGYANQTVGGKSAQADPSYYPALLKPGVRGTKEDKTATSSITGVKYHYKEIKSYGIPFGRTSTGGAADSEEDRRTVLANEARSGTTKAVVVGYDPEVWRGKKSPLADAP